MKQILSFFLALVLLAGLAVPTFAEENPVEESQTETAQTDETQEIGAETTASTVPAAQPTESSQPSESEKPTESSQPSEPEKPTVPPTEPQETDPAETTAPQPTEPEPTETQPTEPEETTEPEQTEPPQFPTQLEIDSRHIFPGMNNSYENGYAPEVRDGYVHVVLPLLATGNIYHNEIKASINPGGSPAFAPTNYEKRFYLEEHQPVNDTRPVELFLIEFDVALSDSRVNGVYPLNIQVSGFDEKAQPITGNYPFYVTITDSPQPEPPKPKGPEWPTPDPVIYIAETKIEPEQVMAGEDFTVTVTLKNSLANKSVSNMLIRVDPGNLQITLLETSHTVQVAKLGAGDQTELSFKFHSDQSIPAGKYNLGFQFTYDSGKVLKINSSDTVTVKIQQPVNMELVMPRFANSVTVGETVPLNLQVMNMGRDRMNNVRCTVSGFGFAPSNTGYIGTMEAGTSKSTKVDLYIVALNASAGNESGEQYGDTTGTVTLTFEDDSGEEFQQTAEFTTTVKRAIAQIPQNDNEAEKQEKANQTWWYVILILGGVILAAVVGIVIFKHSRKKGKDSFYL